MDPKEILNLCIQEGILLDPETLNLFSEESEDIESVKLILAQIKKQTSSRIITKNLFKQNKEKAHDVFLELPQDKQKKLEKLKIKLGLQIEISKEVSTVSGNSLGRTEQVFSNQGLVKVFSKTPSAKQKVGVEDFVGVLRDRFVKLKNILQEHPELDNLVSISKLSMNRGKISLIGMISDKRITKNKNLLFEIEDLTGKTRVLINENKAELYEIAENLPLDSVIGFSGVGDREITFVNNIVLPEAQLVQKKKSPFDESIAFIGDLHHGSKLFLGDEFKRFIDYLNGKNPKTREEAKKIKYLFMAGDVVSGVGVYPNQIRDLKITDLEEQYQSLADLLSRIKRDIKIIISPGNHDGVRLMEPQPVLDEKYAWPLYNLKNTIFTGNPAYVNLGARPEKGFNGFDILTYHGFSYAYYANNIPKLLEKGFNSPESIMTFLLQHRHLAPTYGSMQTFPSDEDQLAITKIPDIFVTGHSHKCAVTYHNNILMISGAAWEEETEYEKRKGNQPDFCKVPVFNMKTRAIKILDFE